MERIKILKRSFSASKHLPFFVQGEVVKGFGRGSKQLGIPTANFPDSVVSMFPDEQDNGIYYGWASVNNGPVYKMVMSVGWNPFYKNEKRSMETHVIHKFKEDFYGALLKVIMLGYLRPEKSFNSLDELISAINCDIQQAHQLLEQPSNKDYANHTFFFNVANSNHGS